MSRKLLPYPVAAAFVSVISSTAMAAGITYPTVSYSAEATHVTLPHNVVPVDYVITIAPDVNTMRVAGTEQVTVNVLESTDTIRFNSSGQRLAHVLLDGEPVQSYRSNEDNQVTTVKLKTPATPGQHKLSLSFVGEIGGKAGAGQGLFTQPYTSQFGSHDYYLTAVFEEGGSRQVFPCWDDPSFKASYQLNVMIPTAWDAWSSMAVAQRDVHGATTTISFRPTNDIAAEMFEFSKVHKIVSPQRYVGQN